MSIPTQINHAANARTEAHRAAKSAFDLYCARNPGASNLKMGGDVFVYRRPPKGFSEHPVIIVTRMLSKLYGKKTNAEIVADLSRDFPGYTIPMGIMYKPLSKRAKGKVAKVLNDFKRPIDLECHNTLSKIKQEIWARDAADDSHASVTVTVAFADNEVIVAGKPAYKVYEHKAGYKRIRVGAQWIRCDVLQELLSAK